MSKLMLLVHVGRNVGKTDISEIGSVILQPNGSLTVVPPGTGPVIFMAPCPR
jgi:hypothetical protein